MSNGPFAGSAGRVTSLAWMGFVQLVRTRVYLNIFVAGVALVVSSLAFDRLSAGEGGRVLFDVGTAFIALVVATLSGTLAITAVTRELETKQAHLVLARPISRTEFVLARFATTALLIVVSNVVLGALLSLLLVAVGGEHPWLALATCAFASFEGFIVAAIAIFFGVGSSSTMSAVFTTTIFVLGRLTGEMDAVIARGTLGAATPVLRVVWFALPHFPAFDLTWLWHSDAAVDAGALARTAVYGVAYAAAVLAAAAFRFSRRDLL